MSIVTRSSSRLVTGLVGMALVVGTLGVPATSLAAGSSRSPRPHVTTPAPVKVSPVPGQEAPAASREQRDAALHSEQLTSSPVHWPRSVGADVGGDSATRARLGAVRVEAPAGSPAIAARVLGQRASRAAGVQGVLVSLAASAGTSASDARQHGDTGAVTVTTDYAGFGHAFGADWAGRLRVLAYPGCLLTTPRKPACQRATELDSTNAPSSGTLTTQVPVAQVTAGRTVLAVAATGSSSTGTGDFTATPFATSSSWSAGGSSGDFSWSYPFRVPPSVNGPAPELALSYSAQSVDGRTPATNNQSSVVGEGFDLSSAYIERGYVSCKDDGVSGKYDECWKTDNATLVMNGSANELVQADDGTWRLTNDDGSRIRRLTSTSANNLDNNKEYWELTGADGVKYYFGRSVVPGQTGDTESVWYVPVAGNNAGEPCHGSTFGASFCNQAWRWNLDYVVDPNGNAMSYWYAAETNNYAKNKVASPGTDYVRGGRLTRIDYGLRDDATTANPPMRVTFANAVRCLAATGCGSYSKAKWPDTPYDQICADGATCTGEYSPTFFTRYRLSKVTTKILENGAYSDVDSWTFDQQFLNSGDVSDATLWLNGITHAGEVGGTKALSDLKLGAVQLVNRVDSPSDGISALPRYRLRTITSETGAVTTVNYSEPDCTPSSKPTPDSNTRRCFPQKWTPEGNTSPRTDWFHKYVVTDVTDSDTTGLGQPVSTYYTYSGGAAWAYDDNKLVADTYRTWSSWRGYGTVTTTKGDPSLTAVQSQEVSTFFRGMDGDKQSSGTPRSVKVTDSTGASLTDDRPLAGYLRETVTYTRAGGEVYSGTINTPWNQTTAGSGLKAAHVVRTSSQETRTALSSGGFRRSRVDTDYDPATGLATRVSDLGDLAVSDDQTCTATVYANALSASGTWRVGFPARVVKSVGACGADALTPTEDEVLSDTRTRYDQQAQGVAPSAGLVTDTERVQGYTSGAATYQLVSHTDYDKFGRPTKVTEPLDDGATRVNTTDYTMSADGTLVGTVDYLDTAGKNFKTTTSIAPQWGEPTKVVDPNLKVTEAAYDPLGRLISVWAPNRARTATPSTKYAYSIVAGQAPSVTTSTLDREGTGYRTKVDVYDSLLRPRQTQVPSPAGGRVLSGSVYDARGLVSQSYTQVYAEGAPSPDLVQFDDGVAPALTKTTYDGLGRPTKATLYSGNSPRWTTTTAYEGADKTTVDPPDGSPSTTTTTDVFGRMTRSVESGTPDLVTDYSYDLAGNLTRLVSPGGTWTYTYDVRGRLTDSTDPDAGDSHYTYTDNDLVKTVTDARGTSTRLVYDSLDRRTAEYEGADVDASRLLASWTYDTLAKGYPTSSTRYVGGSDGDRFTSQITGYNALYNVSDSKFTLTAAADGSSDLTADLPASMTRSTVYNVDQSIDVDYLPRVITNGVTRLSSEAIQYTYDSLGQPTSMTGRTGIVQDVVYDQLGRAQQFVLGAGSATQLYVTNTFDEGTNRLARSLSVTNLSSTVMSDHHFTYDDSGNPLEDADTATGDTQCYRYDDHRRLSDAWTPATGDCTAAPLADALGGPAPYWQSWTFTDNGLRKTQTTTTPAGAATDTYTYPAAGQAHANFATDVTSTGSSVAAGSYGFDDAGNTTSRPDPTGATQALTWDAEGNLASLVSSRAGGDRTTRYVYSADGDLLLRDDPDEKVLYVGETEVRVDKHADPASRTSATRNYSTPAGPVAVRSSDSQIDFMLPDQHGTAGVALDSASLTPAYRYQMPYGEDRGEAPTNWPSTHDFLDKVGDDETGLTATGARQYDAATGRFISADPVLDSSSPAQMLGYSYANNNPLAYSDPSGTMPVDDYGHYPGPPAPIAHHTSPPPAPPSSTLATVVKYATVALIIFASTGGGGASGPPPPAKEESGWAKSTWNATKGAFSSAGNHLKDYGAGAFGATTDLLPNITQMGKIGCSSMGSMAGACASAPEKSNSDLLFDDGQFGVDSHSKMFTLGYWLGIPTPGGAGVTAEKLSVRTLERLATKLFGRSTEEGGLAAVREAGRTGESMAGIVKNTTRIPAESGKAAYRIPDELDSSVLGEVKNVKTLGWSSQISDFYHYASARGLEFRLYVRPNTVFRGQLAKLYEADGFTRVDVPGMGQ